ncbi:MAG TPA: ABC transporter permease [Opitutales bacterium]|nr:ABC transporter permease [Opitutales bacterium]
MSQSPSSSKHSANPLRWIMGHVNDLVNSGLRPLSALFEYIGGSVILLVRSFSHIPVILSQTSRIIEQCFFMGNGTVPIVTVLSFFIGAVLALQTGFVLNQLGVLNFIGSIVGLSLCRELAPVMVAILLAGRVGSATTAELASMTVYSEVDALKTMNIPPEKILVLPRLTAVVLMTPLLTALSIVSGWLGGMIVSKMVAFLQLSPLLYWRNLKDFVLVGDFIDGLIKAEVFCFAVILIACYQGLSTRGGPREIGTSVTKSVVFSLVFILFSDYFITRMQM